MIVIDKDCGNLNWVLPEKSISSSQKDMNNSVPPLNGFSGGTNLRYSKFKNVMISMREYLYVHVHFSEQNEWEFCRIDSLDESEQILLEPFFKSTAY